MGLLGSTLPEFPWDLLVPFKEAAQKYPGGLVDLSVGTPVDPTPASVREALAAASDSHGYPTTQGTPQLREAIARWFDRRRGVPSLDPATQILPTIGSKELVAFLPSLLELGPGDVVVHPSVAYPTYDIGARLAGARAVATDDVEALDRLHELAPDSVKLIWLNSPGNPDGKVASVETMAAVVSWAREHGAVVASDECYAELAWEQPWVSEGVPSILDPRVCGGEHDGLLAVYSLSKQSNLAGYRAAFTAGDPVLIERLLAVRKHAGMIVPGPIQAAMVAALDDDKAVATQRDLYRARRDVLLPSLATASLAVRGSEAGLYLWVTAEGSPLGTSDGDSDGRPACWDLVRGLSELGILVAPGEFYGEQGRSYVRIALTASDQQIAEAAARIAGA